MHTEGLPPNVNASSLCIFQPFLISFSLSSFFSQNETKGPQTNSFQPVERKNPTRRDIILFRHGLENPLFSQKNLLIFLLPILKLNWYKQKNQRIYKSRDVIKRLFNDPCAASCHGWRPGDAGKM